MTSSSDPVRLAGVVREVGDPAPASYTVTLDRAVHQQNHDGWLVVDVDGTAVRVEARGCEIVGDGEDHVGAWSEVRARLGERLGVKAPPFAAVRARAHVVAVGDLVEVYGRVLERGPGDADGGGYREAPPVTIRAVEASLIARGTDAHDALTRAIRRRFPAARRRAARREPRPVDPAHPAYRPPLRDCVPSGVFLVAAVLALILARASVHPGGALAVAIGAIACALLARPGPEFRAFRAGDTPEPTNTEDLARFFVPGLYLATAIPLAIILGARAAFVVNVGFVALLVLLELLIARENARHVTLARTPSWDGRLGVRAAVVGAVRDPTPATLGSTAVALGRTATMERQIGSDPDRVVGTSLTNDGTFLADAPAGVVEIDPAELVWATTVVRRPLAPAFGYDIDEIIPLDGQVAAVGWIEAVEGGPPRLRSRGTTPAILLATGAGGDPRRLAQRLVRYRWVSRAVIAALAAATLALGVRS